MVRHHEASGVRERVFQNDDMANANHLKLRNNKNGDDKAWMEWRKGRSDLERLAVLVAERIVDLEQRLEALADLAKDRMLSVQRLIRIEINFSKS